MEEEKSGLIEGIEIIQEITPPSPVEIIDDGSQTPQEVLEAESPQEVLEAESPQEVLQAETGTDEVEDFRESVFNSLMNAQDALMFLVEQSEAHKAQIEAVEKLVLALQQENEALRRTLKNQNLKKYL